MGLFDWVIPNMNADIPQSLSVSKAFQPMNLDLQKGMPSHSEIAYYSNPLKVLEDLGYKETPSSVSYEVLKRMASRDAVISAIILTRVNQVSSFTKPERYSRDGLGFEIILRDKYAVPTDEQKRVMTAIEVFLENCGFQDDLDSDNFDSFVRKLVRDSLTFDQTCFEIVPDRKGRPSQILAVDSSTIRFASEDYTHMTNFQYKQESKDSKVRWVQIINGEIKAAFSSKELAFGVRNPRSDINVTPYGFSELEQLIHQVTSHLYAEEYNSRYFSQGGTTKGILNIKQDPNTANREQIEMFKRQWKAQVSGLQGAWKTPILQVPGGLEYLNVSQSNREMEFEKWMNYLINVSCAVFQIDPAEVNFPNNGGVGGGGGGIFEGSNEQRLKNSKDKGLRPLLRFLESLINKYIISQFSNEFMFNFTGIDSKTDKEVIDLDQSAVRFYKTVNEIRAQHDMEPIEDGDMILDGTFVQMKQMKQQEEMAQQQAMMQGAMGAEGDPQAEGMEGAEGVDDSGISEETDGSEYEDQEYNTEDDSDEIDSDWEGEEDDEYDEWNDSDVDPEIESELDGEEEDEEDDTVRKSDVVLEIIITE